MQDTEEHIYKAFLNSQRICQELKSKLQTVHKLIIANETPTNNSLKIISGYIENLNNELEGLENSMTSQEAKKAIELSKLLYTKLQNSKSRLKVYTIQNSKSCLQAPETNKIDEYVELIETINSTIESYLKKIQSSKDNNKQPALNISQSYQEKKRKSSEGELVNSLSAKSSRVENDSDNNQITDSNTANQISPTLLFKLLSTKAFINMLDNYLDEIKKIETEVKIEYTNPTNYSKKLKQIHASAENANEYLKDVLPNVSRHFSQTKNDIPYEKKVKCTDFINSTANASEKIVDLIYRYAKLKSNLSLEKLCSIYNREKKRTPSKLAYLITSSRKNKTEDDLKSLENKYQKAKKYLIENNRMHFLELSTLMLKQDSSTTSEIYENKIDFLIEMALLNLQLNQIENLIRKIVKLSFRETKSDTDNKDKLKTHELELEKQRLETEYAELESCIVDAFPEDLSKKNPLMRNLLSSQDNMYDIFVSLMIQVRNRFHLLTSNLTFDPERHDKREQHTIDNCNEIALTSSGKLEKLLKITPDEFERLLRTNSDESSNTKFIHDLKREIYDYMQYTDSLIRLSKAYIIRIIESLIATKVKDNSDIMQECSSSQPVLDSHESQNHQLSNFLSSTNIANSSIDNHTSTSMNTNHF